MATWYLMGRASLRQAALPTLPQFSEDGNMVSHGTRIAATGRIADSATV